MTRPGVRAVNDKAIASEEKTRQEIERQRMTGKMHNMQQNIPLKTVRLAAALGGVDPRTVQGVIDRKPTRPGTRERAIDGLRAAGVAELTLEQIVAAKGDARRLGEIADSVARTKGRP